MTLFSVQSIAGLFHGFALTGEKFLDEEIADLPETVDRTVFNLLIAANHAIFNFLVSPYDAVFHFLVMIIFHILHLNLS